MAAVSAALSDNEGGMLREDHTAVGARRQPLPVAYASSVLKGALDVKDLMATVSIFASSGFNPFLRHSP